MTTKRIPTTRIQPGKLQHKSLTPEQEDLARQIYDACGHLVNPSFEQWEYRFSRDTNPVQELMLWAVIAKAFAHVGSIYPEEDQREVLDQIVLYSTGGTPTKYPEISEIYAAVSREIIE